MRPRARVAVLISGGGSNLQALLDAAAEPDYPAEIVLVLSNRADAGGLARAQRAGVPTEVIEHRAYADRTSFDAALHDALTSVQADLVCLAGFMRVLTDDFVTQWRGRMLNIHPSLLPSFKGLHTHQRALDAGCKLHGCTVHFVEPALDDGPIIAQAAVPVHDDDTADTLAARVLEQEHRLYPQALAAVASGGVRIEGRRVLGVQPTSSIPAKK
jgi:phosphoribosylglycinamide formyltransferase-1